jgi:cytochrome c oxidase cbb3-type subunit 3
MPTAFSISRVLPLVLLLGAIAACDREDRRFQERPPSGLQPNSVSLTELRPGPSTPTVRVATAYNENAFAISEGQRMFNWFNCSGCHANGGGGMGPPLIDDEWIYGSDPAQIYSTIVDGRPNGMPSFRGRIPDSEVWKIVSYVRSLSGLTPRDARPGRNDHMATSPPPSTLTAPSPGQKTSGPPEGD